MYCFITAQYGTIYTANVLRIINVFLNIFLATVLAGG
jgi:hypothetical protein